METYQWVLIVGFVVAGVIAGLAIWSGRAATIGVGPKGLSVRIQAPASTDDVTIAKGANIAGNVASITGRDMQGTPADNQGPRATNVAEGLVVTRGGSIGAITGEKISGTTATAKNPQK